MASLNIDQPIATPADEWASSTADALSSTSAAALHEPSRSRPLAPAFPPPTGQETPGLDIPGSFPRSFSGQSSNDPDSRTPHAAVARLADAAPPNDFGTLTGVDVGKHFDTARSYIPARADVQDAARTYLPDRFAGAFGLSGANGTEIEEGPVETQLDPTSTAKPNVITELSVEDVDSDNVSTTAIPPSTRSPSYQVTLSDASDKTAEPDSVGATLDPTSTAKPSLTYAEPISVTPARTEAPIVTAALAPAQLPTPPESDSSMDRSPAPAGTHSAPAVPAKDEHPALVDPSSAKREASDASANSTDSTSSPGKKEGRARRLVERVKDKLHHRPAGH